MGLVFKGYTDWEKGKMAWWKALYVFVPGKHGRHVFSDFRSDSAGRWDSGWKCFLPLLFVVVLLDTVTGTQVIQNPWTGHSLSKAVVQLQQMNHNQVVQWASPASPEKTVLPGRAWVITHVTEYARPPPPPRPPPPTSLVVHLSKYHITSHQRAPYIWTLTDKYTYKTSTTNLIIHFIFSHPEQLC